MTTLERFISNMYAAINTPLPKTYRTITPRETRTFRSIANMCTYIEELPRHIPWVITDTKGYVITDYDHFYDHNARGDWQQ